MVEHSPGRRVITQLPRQHEGHIATKDKENERQACMNSHRERGSSDNRRADLERCVGKTVARYLLWFLGICQRTIAPPLPGPALLSVAQSPGVWLGPDKEAT